jgi:hypothetical protein
VLSFFSPYTKVVLTAGSPKRIGIYRNVNKNPQDEALLPFIVRQWCGCPERLISGYTLADPVFKNKKKRHKNSSPHIPFHMQPAVIDTNQWIKSQALIVEPCNMLK